MNKPEENSMNASFTLRWLVQAGLGIMLVLLLAIHLIVNHWAAPQGLLTYADVVRYYDTPGIAWMEAVFLMVVTAHCMLGLHSILLDLNWSARVTRVATRILTFVGLTTILYGIWLTRTLASR
jgi:succinate dehydrogenase hydrophobic anchor subunit